MSFITADSLAASLERQGKGRLFRLMAQGARCGHIEGRERCGAYVLGEEIALSHDAAANNTCHEEEQDCWATGYRMGYRMGASGQELQTAYAKAPLP